MGLTAAPHDRVHGDRHARRAHPVRRAERRGAPPVLVLEREHVGLGLPERSGQGGGQARGAVERNARDGSRH